MPTPNFVVLCADQLRPFELGCYGHPRVPTPHLDRLAALGVRFTTACTTNPVCTPARSSLVSGQYGRTCIGMLGCCGEPAERRNKFPDTTLPELLSVGGYDTFLSGKWHIDPNPLRLGFAARTIPACITSTRGKRITTARAARGWKTASARRPRCGRRAPS
jgi:arylsulfatase A-like enzyme